MKEEDCDNKAKVILPDAITPREMMPGGYARFYHTEYMTLAVWVFEPGAELPNHNHPHEQITTMIEGRFEMNLDGTLVVLEKGTVVTIPPYVSHSGRAITSCHIVDVFYPVREDFKQ